MMVMTSSHMSIYGLVGRDTHVIWNGCLDG